MASSVPHSHNWLVSGLCLCGAAIQYPRLLVPHLAAPPPPPSRLKSSSLKSLVFRSSSLQDFSSVIFIYNLLYTFLRL